MGTDRDKLPARGRSGGAGLSAIVFLVFTALHLYAAGVARLYPFTDLPNHLAAAV